VLKLCICSMGCHRAGVVLTGGGGGGGGSSVDPAQGRCGCPASTSVSVVCRVWFVYLLNAGWRPRMNWGLGHRPGLCSACSAVSREQAPLISRRALRTAAMFASGLMSSSACGPSYSQRHSPGSERDAWTSHTVVVVTPNPGPPEVSRGPRSVTHSAAGASSP
jgi:hypothetical protein